MYMSSILVFVQTKIVIDQKFSMFSQEAVEAYKHQNKFLSSEILELNALRADDEEAFRNLTSRYHQVEAECKHTYTHRRCAHMRAHTHICTHARTHTCTLSYTLTHTHARTHTYTTYTCTQSHTRARTRTHTCTRARTHTHTHMHAHAHAHIRTHARTHAQ